MIFVDTSVWISYFRGASPALTRHLDKLLDEDHCALSRPVRIELLLGVSGHHLPRFRRLISAIPLYDPSPQTWPLIEDWVERARSKGQRFGFADMLIAAVAAENQGAIWSLDHDFRRMEKLGFVGCHALPKS